MSIEDSAQAHEAQEWEIRNRRREVLVHQPGDASYGPAECNQCGDDMHPVRRAYGYVMCTPCAEARERRR